MSAHTHQREKYDRRVTGKHMFEVITHIHMIAPPLEVKQEEEFPCG
jgi:hypothetical protein